ncbi:YEATS domain-containing protein 4 [Cuculus canorus]|uniref:YEATS domain-containing protein 4 n=1 Tax=Cuculus canorus TaxID=55661 RepID=UPI0023AA3BBB|nr:YEATS domain-containing protein 4 [Cuculus canorus]
MTSRPSSVATAPLSLVSSADSLRVHSISLSLSLMKILNSTGPSADPCGTPPVTALHLDLRPTAPTRPPARSYADTLTPARRKPEAGSGGCGRRRGGARRWRRSRGAGGGRRPPRGNMFKRMAEFGPDSGGRVKGVTIVKPIVYGNVARYFGKKREEDGHTHQWTVYVKPYRNEDMSAYVKKIQFKLHESYGNPLRVVTKPPYEITETGWGEFEIIIKIFFIDPNERPVTLYHLLKLFQSDTNAILGKKTVVSEFYDEMIFQDPTAMMQQLLTTSRQLTLGAYKHETEFADLEVKTREKLEAAKKKTSFEIAELKERLKASRETINCLKNEIRKLEEDDQSKDM